MDNFDYLFNEADINSTQKVSAKVLVRNNKNKTKLIAREDELSKLLPEIEKGTSLHLISAENFGSVELIRLLNKREKIKKILLTTWSYNEDFVSFCKEFAKQRSEMIFCVDKSIKTRKAHLYAQIINLQYEHKNFIVKIHYMIHSKVTIIETENKFISIESSANYSNNTRVENFTITESKELFNFHKSWINEIVGK